MNDQQLYVMYRDEASMPGESTRALTNEYVRLKSTGSYSNEQLCKNLLTIRFETYKLMGMEIKDSLPKSIIEIANGYFPFIIFADTFVVNHNNVIDNLEAIIDTLDIIINVIIDEFNKIVNSSEKIVDREILKIKAARLIKEQTGISA